MATPLTYVANPTYARFQVLKNGTAVDPSTILSVSTTGSETVTTCTTATNGKYVYNTSGIGTLTVALQNITAGEFPQYQVVCFLSDGTGTETAGVLTTEPDPDLKYTYSFTYPMHTEVVQLDLSQTQNVSLQLNIHSDVLSYFNKTEAQMKDSWYGRWYVRNKSTKAKQPLGFDGKQGDNVWNVFIYRDNGSYSNGDWYGITIANNQAYVSSKTGTDASNHNYATYNTEKIARSLGFLQIYAPSQYTKLSDCTDYEIVYEVTDEYESGEPTIKLQYVFKFPEAVVFEGEANVNSATDSGTQAIAAADRTAASVAVDLTNKAFQHAKVSGTAIKYARFYLTDLNDNPVATQDGLLEVKYNGTDATLRDGEASGNGYYIYNDGYELDKSLISVSMKTPGNHKRYKLVCLFSTELANIDTSAGLVAEPDWDLKYTYDFTYEITTVEKFATIAWSATQMTADATAGAPDDWNTTWADLSLEQRVVWYVTDGSGTKQALAIGTGAAADTWTISAGTGFTLDANQAVLTGQTSFTEALWNTWGKPAIYAPSNKAYADVHDYKVICEVYESATGTTPNVLYTFTFRKDFPGTLKSGATTSTKREVLTAGAVTCTLSDVTLPAGTKYVRFYLTDGSNAIVAPTGLSVTGATAVSVTGYENYGYYLYDEEGITAPPTVKLTLTEAELNLYKVVMVTSADRAVVSGGAVTSEPDYDTQKTWTFKYPTNKVEDTAEQEWNADKMEVAAVPIETLKSSDYLDGVKASYLVRWTVEDAAGTVQPLVAGHARQTGTWSFSRTPYTVSGNAATINSNASLSNENWATWGAPVFYAPAEATFNNVKDLLLVCRLYEADEVDEPSLAIEYKVSIVKTSFYGQLKHGATEASETVENILEDAASVSVPLANALTVFGQSAKYARIWLTNKSGALVSQSPLTVSGANTFSSTHTNYGYYISDASAISLPAATLTATDFTQYQVHVALSTDAPVNTSAFARGMNRAESLTSYEPDYDFQYTFDFAYEQKGTIINKYLTWDGPNKVLDLSDDVTAAGLSDDGFYLKWYVLDGNGEKQSLAATASINNGASTTDSWQLFASYGTQIYPYSLNGDSKFLYLAKKTDQWGNNVWSEYVTKPTVYAPQGQTFEDFSDYTVVCEVYPSTPPTVDSGTVTSEPDPTTGTKYIFHFTANGLDPFIGEEKSAIVSGTKVVEITNSAVTSVSGINVTDQRAVAALVAGGFVPKYVRWQVLDQDDNLVDGVLTTGATTTKAEGLGEYIYNSTGTLDLLRGLSIDVSGQAVKDLTQYRIVGLVSDCSSDDHLVMNGLKVKEEPDFDLKVTVTFETAFRGKLTKNAVEREIVITQVASQWDRTVTNQSEFMIEISDADKTVTLKDAGGNVRVTKDLDILADLKTATGESYSSLNDLTNLYVRWCLERKDGSAVVVKGAIRKDGDNSSDVHFLPNNATEGANLAHGFYWYKNGTTYSIASAGTPANAVKVKFVQSGQYLPTDGIDITDYNLVLNVSTHPYSQYDAAYVNDDHTINHEPNDLDLRYVFNFQNRSFPAENIATVKTIYKDALYTIERDTDDNPVSGKITPVLFAPSGYEVAADAGVSLAKLASDGYARWYVTDAAGNIVSDLSDWGFTASKTYTKNDNYGHYIRLTDISGHQVGNQYDPTITLPAGYNLETAYKNYKVVCVVTTDLTGMELPTNEPATMQVKYVFSLIYTEGEYAALPFVHYKGQTGRDWVKPEESNGNLAQQIWDTVAGDVTEYTGDIRQGVHTWEYDVYLSDNVDRQLLLPLELYNGNGNNLEPRAYFRWYDYTTDQAFTGSDLIKMVAQTGSQLESINDAAGRDRGLFAICLNESPTQKNVGVRVQTQSGYVMQGKTWHIACDVSKYADGIRTIGDKNYLVHEPTLSTRYIFHIYPGSVIANDMAAADRKLRVIQQQIAETADSDEKHRIFSENEYEMFDVHENKGKVVVSLGAAGTKFSLRLDEHLLQNYKLWENNDPSSGVLKTADRITWVAFYENDKHVLRKELRHHIKNRVETFTYKDFLDGSHISTQGADWEHCTQYHTITTGSDREYFTITDGKKFHVVGYVGDETMNTKERTGTYAPVAHYEIHFLQAPPVKLTDLKNDEGVRQANLNRTDEYMKAHYDLKRIVDFDGNPETNPNLEGREAEFYSTPNWYDAPATSAENVTWTPRQWSDIEYGFCYPQLTQYIKNGYTFFSPEHGDYMIIKSMNVAGISKSDDGGTAPYSYHWWDGTELYDYTHTYTDASKYGSFLYTDASDESRTMVTIPFNAELCAGSTIYFTMAVADKTEANKVPPQLLVRIVGIDGEGNHSRVVAFHTSDIRSAGASASHGVWWQVYGESTIPVTFDDTVESFIAEVINYADDTNGADFAIDQLQIYTSTAKVQMTQQPSSCEDPTAGKVKIYVDAEGMQNIYLKDKDTKKIYWRICDEETGEVVTGPGMYPRYAYNESTNTWTTTDYDMGTTDPTDPTKKVYNQYGEAWVVTNFNPTTDVYAFDTEGVGHLPEIGETGGAPFGWYKGADNTVYFQISYRDLPAIKEGKTYYVSIYDPTESQKYSVNFREAYWGGLHHGATSKCSVFSSFFLSRRQYVTYSDADGNVEGGATIAECGQPAEAVNLPMLLKVPDATEPTGFRTVSGLHYDFAYLSLDTWNITDNNDTFGDNYTYELLRTAWRDYRGATSAYKETVGLDAAYQQVNANYYAVLKYAVDNKFLELTASSTFSHRFVNDAGKPITNGIVTCLPIEQTLAESDDYSRAICTPFEVDFHIKEAQPDLALGFPDVSYPTEGFEKRVLRVGLEQLTNLKEEGYVLHVPVNRYNDKDMTDGADEMKRARRLYFEDPVLTLSSDVDAPEFDPACRAKVKATEGNLKFASIVSTDSRSEHPYVDFDHMYIALDLSQCEIPFHEGYEYEVHTTFFDQEDASDADGNLQTDADGKFIVAQNACRGDLFLIIKVVPEYVTWTGQEIASYDTTDDGVDNPTHFYSANWNDDKNWTRSVRDSLYKDGTALGAKNTATDGHPLGYMNNGEGTLSDLGTATGNPGFVPMKFTYVTIPGVKYAHAPNLTTQPTAYGDPATEKYRGGNLITGTLQTDPSPMGNGYTTPTSCDPTAGIRFDMLVRYTETDCQGHYNKAKEVVGEGTAKVYDCEKYYGNICREIYFKPGAELQKQQRLTYEKAWVEKELQPNRWYLMAAPLRATYAGDMYVPYNTTVAKNGRQTTEAFQPINFANAAGYAYSRTKYPMYQHAWGNADLTGGVGPRVYTTENDVRQTSYSAVLNYGSTWSGNVVEWSHTYDDVQVPYSELTAYAIRAHKKTTAGNATLPSALLRLPKADTSYDYYKWDSTKPDPDAGNGIKTVEKKISSPTKPEIFSGEEFNQDPNAYAKLVADKDYQTDAVTVDISKAQHLDGYVLVGNPYMSSISMRAFFNADENELDESRVPNRDAIKNGKLEKSYWIYDETTGELRAYKESGVIRPLQAFFLKTSANVTFTPRMMMDYWNGETPGVNGGSSTGGTTEPAPARPMLMLTAQGGSQATVELVDEASADYVVNEDVETLFDEHLADMPTVFTVAGSQAVSIDERPQLGLLPFGVACSTTEPVNVTISLGSSSIASTTSTTLYLYDAAANTQTEVFDGQTVSIVPNDYGRYFLSSETLNIGGAEQEQQSIIVSVRGRQVTVSSSADISRVQAVSIGGGTVYEADDCGRSASFQLSRGSYVITAEGDAGQRTMKVVVR